MVLSDEIYSRLMFEGEHFSIMSVPGFKDRTILLDGFSKTYAMTGWRMGYGVMRPDLAAHFTRLMTNSNSCTASFTQIAGVEALRGDQTSVDQMRERIQAPPRRIRRWAEPDQRLLLPHAERCVLRSRTSGNRMEVQEARQCTPRRSRCGRSFGHGIRRYGEGYLRFSVANSLENLQKALDRIDQWTKKNL